MDKRMRVMGLLLQPFHWECQIDAYERIAFTVYPPRSIESNRECRAYNLADTRKCGHIDDSDVLMLRREKNMPDMMTVGATAEADSLPPDSCLPAQEQLF